MLISSSSASSFYSIMINEYKDFLPLFKSFSLLRTMFISNHETSKNDMSL